MAIISTESPPPPFGSYKHGKLHMPPRSPCHLLPNASTTSPTAQAFFFIFPFQFDSSFDSPWPGFTFTSYCMAFRKAGIWGGGAALMGRNKTPIIKGLNEESRNYMSLSIKKLICQERQQRGGGAAWGQPSLSPHALIKLFSRNISTL